MARFNVMLLSTVICVVVITSQAFVFPVEDESDFVPIKDDTYDIFDWRLFKSAANQAKGENAVVSPFSTKILLSVLSEAASPSAKKQLIEHVLPLPEEKTRTYYRKVLKSLAEESDAFEFNIASKIYVDKHLTPSRRFLQVVSNIYKTPTDKISFGNRNEAARTVNQWCAKKTKNHIKDLVTADDMTDVVALLVNAIYFKGTWHSIFPDQYTRLGKFRIDSKQTVKVDYMTNDGEYFYFATKLPSQKAVKILRLPYKGGKYAMTFLLPEKPDGLDDMIASIRPGQIRYLQKRLEKQFVQITLPKFHFDSKTHLKDIVKSLGITEIFNDNAPLPDFGGNGQVYISNIIQKAGVTVDEKGTEIYAATDIESSSRSSDIPSFRAHHPFMFFIEDESTGAILFAGKVVDPTMH